jgi:hypothetical protein
LTVFAPFIVTLQVPAPVQAPVHPLKFAPAPTEALSVTVESEVNDAEQVAPHVMPDGTDVTVPDVASEPLRTTVSVELAGRTWKVCVTVGAAL